MPVVTVKDEFTPSTFNTQPLSGRMSGVFARRFGADRVLQSDPVMGGEDFSRYYLADKSIQSLIFWVGGVPKDKWEAAQAGKLQLPLAPQPLLGARCRSSDRHPPPRR